MPNFGATRRIVFLTHLRMRALDEGHEQVLMIVPSSMIPLWRELAKGISNVQVMNCLTFIKGTAYSRRKHLIGLDELYPDSLRKVQYHLKLVLRDFPHEDIINNKLFNRPTAETSTGTAHHSSRDSTTTV